MTSRASNEDGSRGGGGGRNADASFSLQITALSEKDTRQRNRHHNERSTRRKPSWLKTHLHVPIKGLPGCQARWQEGCAGLAASSEKGGFQGKRKFCLHPDGKHRQAARRGPKPRRSWAAPRDVTTSWFQEGDPGSSRLPTSRVTESPKRQHRPTQGRKGTGKSAVRSF